MHPNVCKLLGVCTDPASPLCIVIEFMSEGSLWDVLTEREIEMSPRLVLSLARDVVSGMSHLHVSTLQLEI